MQHTRQQIVDYLQANRVSNPVEMSRALLVTAANIRHHLKILKENGVVEVVGTQPGRSRGRPHQLYSLTDNALKQNLDGLAHALLKVIFSSPGDAGQTLQQITDNILGDYQPPANIHARLTKGIEKLNHLEYQASWEASPDGPRIIFRNCPFAMIINEHPILCKMDENLTSKLLGRPFQQVAKLERTPEGAPHCAFISPAK